VTSLTSAACFRWRAQTIPNSAGSQFFICHGDPRFLDRQYTAFGKLIQGDDVLEKIATTPTQPGDRPTKRMNIESIQIVPADAVK
jgi:peptidyl-prolyl cis-trans isomerase B (cyclophilin B)